MNNQEQDFMMNEMSYLANTLHRLFYRKRFPEFELSDTPVGVLRQIDGMVFNLLHEYEELKHKLQKVEALEKERDEYSFMVGKILETIPVRSVLRATGSIGDSVEYFKQLHRERDELRMHLAESRANDRAAMGYLSQVREIVGGGDFPAMVEKVRGLAQELDNAQQERDELAAKLEERHGDAVLFDFYDVSNYPALIDAQAEHIVRLQDAARKNVKPWEDTFPPTLLPAHLEKMEALNAQVRLQFEQPAADPDTTNAMIEAGFDELESRGYRVTDLTSDDLVCVFNAMFAASTQPSKEQGDAVND